MFLLIGLLLSSSSYVQRLCGYNNYGWLLYIRSDELLGRNGENCHHCFRNARWNVLLMFDFVP
jgi:hypothetical protein